LRPFWGRLDGTDLERIAVFIPPLLGAGTVVALYFLTRRHFGSGTALLAGGILSVLSGHFWYSQVGFIDHHAAVAFVSTATLAAAMAMLAGASGAGGYSAQSWARAMAAGLGIGVSLLVWPGTLLHVGLIEAGLIAFLATRRDRAAAVDFAGKLVATHAVAFALLFPSGFAAHWAHWGRFSPVVLSGFQPWAMAVGGLGSAACAGFWRFDSAGASPWRRAATAFAIGVLLLGASGWVFPGLSSGFGDAWEWFAKTDSFQGQVVESMPLFTHEGVFTLATAFTRLSVFSILVPFALCGGVALALREKNRAPILLFYFWTFGLCAATIFQRRFFNSASVAIAVLFALSWVWTNAVLVRRAPRWGRPAAPVATTAVALVLLLPVC
jgi:asparagine N-glycosylation enzyme membrane subunit Stt3